MPEFPPTRWQLVRCRVPTALACLAEHGAPHDRERRCRRHLFKHRERFPVKRDGRIAIHIDETSAASPAARCRGAATREIVQERRCEGASPATELAGWRDGDSVLMETCER